MSRLRRLPILGLAVLVAAASSARAQNQYIGYVYPAGGQQGNTFPIRLGGQRLVHASELVVSGEGVSVRLVDFYQVWNNQELQLLREQLAELRKKETTVGDVMAEEVGAAGREAAGEALEAFAERYGAAAAEVVLGYGDVDFGRLA